MTARRDYGAVSGCRPHARLNNNRDRSGLRMGSNRQQATSNNPLRSPLPLGEGSGEGPPLLLVACCLLPVRHLFNSVDYDCGQSTNKNARLSRDPERRDGTTLVSPDVIGGHSTLYRADPLPPCGQELPGEFEALSAAGFHSPGSLVSLARPLLFPFDAHY